MDGEKSVSSCQRTIPEELADTSRTSETDPDSPLAEVTQPSILQDASTGDKIMPIEEEHVSRKAVKDESVLLNNNDEQQGNDTLAEETHINPCAVETHMFLSDSLNANAPNKADAPDDNTLQNSLSIECLDRIKKVHENNLGMPADLSEVKDLSSPLSNEVPLSRKMDGYESCDFEGTSSETCLDELDTESAKLLQKTTDFKEEFCNHIGQRTSTSSTRPYESPAYRPTLADDSKSVKITLPTNPINLMQTNVQFLSRSRNFLNFITEKSSNIMEKALLPQQLAVKYNSVLKTIDSTYNEKKCMDNSYASTEPRPVEIATNSVQDIFIETKDTLPESPSNVRNENQLECTGDDTNHNNCMINSETHNTYSLVEQSITDLQPINKTVNGLIPIEHKVDNVDNYKSQMYKIDEVDNSNTIAEKVKPEIVCTETNGSVNAGMDETVLYSQSDNGTVTPTRNAQAQDTNLEEVDAESSKHGLLQHPAYYTLLKDYADLKAKNLKLQERVEHLEERNRTLEAEKSGEIFTVQIETLEKTVNRLTSELRTSLASQETLKREYNAANKERESMVMKYAVGEKQLIDTQRARDTAERKVKELTKDQELLQNKLRQAQGERTRICNILDGKCREVMELQKEVEKLKEDVKMRDVKLKWTQNKLKTEMDLQKETQQKLDKAMMRINEMKEECEQVRRESQESIRKFQQSEENKAVTLDQQLKEQQARLILERHVTEDKEMLRLQLQKEVDVLKNRQQVLIEENNTLSLKIQDLEKNRLNYESNFSSLKVIADQRQKEIVDLLDKVSQLETLKVQLQHKEQILEATKTEMEHLRLANEEMQNDMRACRQREADMLDFTQKLTDKNVRLQSEFTAIEAKARQLETEHGPLHERISELSARIKVLEENLLQEQKTRNEECEILARHLAEQTQAAQNLAQKLEDSQGENAVLKRKQQITVKELTRELQQCRRRLEAFEAASPSNSLDIASRTGSNVSLNTADALNGALSDHSTNGDQLLQPGDRGKQALIERMLELQQINAKRAQKLDFMEEHTRALVAELQKKTKIIQNYILHNNPGAMGSNERDRHKAELARHGGIMASVYNQRVSDENMTLELSLEINQKLQAVLEDALLKNITLKDNIDTLGEEIARLTMQNQQRQISK